MSNLIKQKSYYTIPPLSISRERNSLRSASIKLRVDGKLKYVDLMHIAFLKSDKNNTIFTLVDGTELRVAKTLLIFEEELRDIVNFVRPHRSYIVNFDHVQDLEFNCRGGDIQINGKRIQISRRKAAEFRRKYRRYISNFGASEFAMIRLKAN